jgi:hypothetical protein
VWIGDVGENYHEEVDLIPAGDNSGPNFGWRCYEGNAPFNTAGCQSASSYVFPITTHDHPVIGGDFCAVIGGRVYRGSEFPHLFGQYVYGELCTGALWTLKPDGLGGWVDSQALDSSWAGLTGIGDGIDGSLYVTNLVQNAIYKVRDRCPMDPPQITVAGDSLISSSASGYQWFLNGDSIAGADEQTYVPTQSGDYSIVGSFANGCELSSTAVAFVFTIVAGAEDLSIRTWPQPVTEQWHLERVGKATDDWRVTVRDAGGRGVRYTTWPAGAPQLLLDVRDLARGSYVVDIRDDRGVIMHRARFTKL